MKKKLLIALFAITAALCAAFGFAACDGKEDDPVTPPTDITIQDTEKKKFDDAVKAANDRIAQLEADKNFSCYFNSTEYFFDKTKVKKQYYGTNSGEVYYSFENGKNYLYGYDNGVWNKSESETSVDQLLSECLTMFKTAKWETLEFGAMLKGETVINGKTEEVYLTNKSNCFDISKRDPEFGDYTSLILIQKFNETTVDLPKIGPVVDVGAKEKEEMAKLNTFLSDAQASRNFTYMTAMSDGKLYIAEVADKKIKVTHDGETFYYTQIADKNYVISKGDDGKWHQKQFDEVDVDGGIENILNTFADGNWSYSTSYNMLVGNAKVNEEQKEVGVKFVDANGGELWLVNPKTAASNEFYYRIHNKNKTSFMLPAEIVNDDAPVNTEDIYDKQGNINLLALAEVFKENIKNENIKNDLYFEFTDEAVKFYVYEQGVNGQNMLRTYDMISAIWNDVKKAETKTEMLELLSKINRPIRALAHVDAEYSTTDYTPEQKAQFDAMTRNIFAELNIDGLEEKNVKFAFKTPHGKINASASNGYLYATAWDHYYVVEINGNLELLKVGVRASTSRNEGEIDNVINHPEYWNINGPPVKTLLQSGNKVFYNTF